MPKRTPLSKPGAADDWQITDEWGIYDPGKAGMPALFKRLGRPVLQPSPKATLQERRRARRPERPAHGVGLALIEARRRAGLEPAADGEPIPQSPARAMKAALRAQAAAAPTHFVPDAEPWSPQAPVPVATPTPEALCEPAAEAPAAPAVARSKRPSRKRSAKAGPVASAELPVQESPKQAPATPLPVSSDRTQPRRAKARAKSTAPATSSATTAEVQPATPTKKAGPPSPSPRRPRGPVPLAAWAHASDDTERPAPRRLDPLGFWRGWFRMPAEVALVEYARGARIHRLLIEAVEDQPADLF